MQNLAYQAIFDCIQGGQFQNALSLINEAFQNWPNDPYLFYCAGLAHRRLNNYQEASNCYRKSVEIDPSNPSVHLGLGIIFQLQGSYDMAIESFKEANRLDRQFPEAHNSLGLTYSKMGQYREALDCYERAAEGIVDIAYSQLAKDEERYFQSRVTPDGENVLMMMPEAMERVEIILKSNLMWAINRNNAGCCLAALGERDRAKEVFEESIKFIPDGLTYDAPYLGLRDLT